MTVAVPAPKVESASALAIMPLATRIFGYSVRGSLQSSLPFESHPRKKAENKLSVEFFLSEKDK